MRIKRLAVEGFKHLRGIDLRFPSKGTFLIQGSNEAGKSSLFEAVFFALFGRALQARSTEELIGYGLNEAVVYLELELADDLLRVERRIRRNRTNVAKLRIGNELLTTVREVNRRIQEELHLDADTLLNSCFVEQKALERLEGMDRSARESAVMKLLNLDRMQAIEEELSLKREDLRQVEDLERKVRLAEIGEKIPEIEEEISRNERLLGFWEVKQLRVQAEENRKKADEEEKKIPALEEERNNWQKKADELKKLRNKEHKVDNLISSLRLLKEKEATLESIGKEIEVVAGAKESLPSIKEKRRKASTLLNILKKLKELFQLRDEIKKWMQLQSQLEEVESKKSILELNLKAKEEKIKEKENIKELLQKLKDIEGKRAYIEKKKELEGRASFYKTCGIAGISSAVLLFLLILSPLKWLSLIALLPLACGIVAFIKRGNLLIKIAKIEPLIGKVDIDEREKIKGQLESYGLIPEEEEWIERELVKQEEEKNKLENEKEKLATEIRRLEIEVGSIERELVNFPPYFQTSTREQVVQRQEKAEEIIGERLEKIKEVAVKYGLSLEMEDLTKDLGKLDSEIKSLENLISKESELNRKKEEMGREIEEVREKIKEDSKVFEGEVSDIFSFEEWERLRIKLKKRMDELERERPEERLQSAISRLAAQRQKIDSLREEASKLEEKADEKLKELGGEFPSDLPPLEEISRTLNEKRAELIQLEREKKLLKEQIIGDIPPLEQCREEYEKLKREHKVRELSVRILETARRNITQKILPRTIDHMWRILPLITNDRYRQVDLDAETFKIRVFDERAGDWKDKNIFSGGTRDQMSLALRLSFALASLPQERGTAPSFLFLDEPLSSFDEQRKEALIRVITEGEIAERFDQIFVISHTPLLNPNLFHYYIFMENGRIKECSEELRPSEQGVFL